MERIGSDSEGMTAANAAKACRCGQGFPRDDSALPLAGLSRNRQGQACLML